MTIEDQVLEEKMASTASRLRSDLTLLTQRLGTLVEQLPVKYLDRYGGGVEYHCSGILLG